MGRSWTLDEMKTIRGLWGVLPASEIGKRLKRTRSSIIGKAFREGLSMPDSNRSWTDTDMDDLRALCAKNWEYERIARELDRTHEAIKCKCKELGLRATQTAAIVSLKVSYSPTVMLPQVTVDPTFPTAKPWEQRAHGQCAYPVSQVEGTTFSCCDPVYVSERREWAYCKKHVRVMYERARTRAA
jgi:hypothetical protein